MTLGGTKKEWQRLLHRIADLCAEGQAADAIVAVTESLFCVPDEPGGRPAAVTSQDLGRILAKMAAGKTDAAEHVAKQGGTSQRTLWRYLDVLTQKECLHQFRVVWHHLFNIGIRRFGLNRLGYEVYIDEHQVSFFGKNRLRRIKLGDKEVWEWNRDGGKGSESSLAAGASKKDKYSGKFRALTYQVMVARFYYSGVILPLDVVLVSGHKQTLPDGSVLAPLSKEWIIDHFIGLLEALYPPPRLIVFDRGYHANVNYTRLSNYCQRFNCRYLTPAIRAARDYFDAGDGHAYANLEDYVDRNKAKAKRHGTGGVHYLVARKPITGDPANVRSLITFFRPRKKGHDLPESSIILDDNHFAFMFYTNEEDPEAVIGWWEQAYSRRWNQENWFKKRSTNFHDGRGHKLVRRIIVFLTGILCLAVYGLAQGRQYPEHDVSTLSRDFPVPRFVLTLVQGLDKG